MVAAEEPDTDDPEQLVSLQPQTPGDYVWLDDHTLLFQPEFPGLQRGAQYQVIVDAQQAGLEQDFTHSFTVEGKLVVRFVIAPQGMIESVTIVSSTLNNERVESCVVNRIRRWDDFGAIDPKKGKMTIRQVYTFGY